MNHVHLKPPTVACIAPLSSGAKITKIGNIYRWPVMHYLFMTAVIATEMNTYVNHMHEVDPQRNK